MTVTITRSDLDAALQLPYRAARLLEESLTPALGYAGPTVTTVRAWNGNIVVNDMTACHRANQVEPWLSDAGGHHSDIRHSEFYDPIIDVLVEPPDAAHP